MINTIARIYYFFFPIHHFFVVTGSGSLYRVTDTVINNWPWPQIVKCEGEAGGGESIQEKLKGGSFVGIGESIELFGPYKPKDRMIYESDSIQPAAKTSFVVGIFMKKNRAIRCQREVKKLTLGEGPRIFDLRWAKHTKKTLRAILFSRNDESKKFFPYFSVISYHKILIK